MKSTEKNSVGILNEQLFDLVDSFPRANTELMDFHFKSTVDDYLDAVKNTAGRKALVLAEDSAQASLALRRLLLVADLVIFNCSSYAISPKISFFPIPDETKSPVLGMISVVDPENRRPRPPRPVEVAYVSAVLANKALNSSAEIRLLGIHWDGTQQGWERSDFTRTSEPYQNELGEPCHIAGGWVHVQWPDLLEEARTLLTSGRALFAPFVQATPGLKAVDEPVLKGSLLDATFATPSGAIRTASGSVHPITDIQLPCLENVPLAILGQILEDERESIAAFRRQLDRVIEDVETSADPAEAARCIRQSRRDLEDELHRVRETYERICRMNALTRIGAYVGTGGLSIAALLGLDPPSAVCGASGIATATTAELYRNCEEKRALRKSPMYFAWKLQALG